MNSAIIRNPLTIKHSVLPPFYLTSLEQSRLLGTVEVFNDRTPCTIYQDSTYRPNDPIRIPTPGMSSLGFSSTLWEWRVVRIRKGRGSVGERGRGGGLRAQPLLDSA